MSAPSATREIDGVVDAFGTEHLGGGVEVEHRHARPAEAVGGPEADQADDRERVQCRWSVMTEIESPTAMSSLSAVALSMTTSVSPLGALPSRITIGLSDVSPSHEMPKRRRPAAAHGLAVGSDDDRVALDARIDRAHARHRLHGVERGWPASGRAVLPSLVSPKASWVRTSRSMFG